MAATTAVPQGATRVVECPFRPNDIVLIPAETTIIRNGERTTTKFAQRIRVRFTDAGHINYATSRGRLPRIGWVSGAGGNMGVEVTPELANANRKTLQLW